MAIYLYDVGTIVQTMLRTIVEIDQERNVIFYNGYNLFKRLTWESFIVFLLKEDRREIKATKKILTGESFVYSF